MVVSSSATSSSRNRRALPSISSGDVARYTRDLLETLKGIALRQDQMVLARLLEAASREAERLTKR